MLLPIQAGNSNRDDILAIENSLLQSLGSAMTNEQMSNIEILCCALSRAIYIIWATQINAGNQFDPQTIDTLLDRWLAIFNIQPLPTDNLGSLRDQIQEKFSLLNQIPNNSNVRNLLTNIVPAIFELLILTPAIHAYAGPGPSNVGPTINSSTWYSTAANIYIDLQKPANMTQYTFWTQAYKIFPVLNQYLPAWTVFDWFNNSFSSAGTISLGEGNTEAIGTGTAWATPTNPIRGSYAIEEGSIIEVFDTLGNFYRLQVDSVNSDTILTLTAPSPVTINQLPYFIQGFFCDCSPSLFPYPPVSWNTDNAAIDAPALNYI